MSFLSIATPFVQLGIPVFPLTPKTKIPPSGFHFLEEATIDPAKVASWNDENPDYNVALLANGEFCFLEFDIAKGMSTAAAEMGYEIPLTRTQVSGKGFGHYIFRHTERSRSLGNRSVNLPEGGEWFSFRAGNKYLVGAGSIHPNGRHYQNARDIEPIPMPNWLCDFVEKHSTPSKPTSCDDAVEVADDFDFDDMMDFYGIGIAGEKDDVWQVVEECPGVGYRHSGSTLTAFYWDGTSLGWSCFAQGCPLHGKSIGQVIAFLNAQKGEPYTGPIWEQDDSDLDGVDMLDDDDELPTPHPPPDCWNKPENVPLMTATVDTSTGVNATILSTGANPPEPQDEEPEEDEAMDKPAADTNLKLSGYLANDNGGMGLITQCAASIVMTELEWLWPQRVPKGKMTFFTGKPDCCKSMVLLDLIARATTGKDFPDGSKNENPPCKVLIAASEDDPNDTLVPRLVAAGADLNMVDLVHGTMVEITGKNKTTKRKRTKLDLKRDAKLLLESIKVHPDIKLLALDPITSFLGDADTNKDKDIRPIVDEITRVCNKSGITIVGIIHSNKRSDVDAVHKVSGAGALAASVRAVWGFSRDSEEKTKYHMAHVKGNLGKDKSGINYSIEEAQVTLSNGKSVGIPHIVWGEKIDEDADDLLSAERANRDGKDTKMIMATALIRSMLPAKATDIFTKAEAEGISPSTVRNARYKMPDVKVTHDAPNGTVDRQWWWVKVGEPSKPWKNVEEAVITEDLIL